MSEENGADKYVVTKANETTTKGNKTHEIDVTKRVDRVDPEKVIIITKVVETEEKGRNESKVTEDTLEKYDVVSGHSVMTETTQENEKLRRNGDTKTVDKQYVKTTYNESGAVAHAGGYEYTKSSTHTSTKHEKYDKNGHIKESSVNVEHNGVNESYRRDEKLTHDYDEKKGIGASKLDELKQEEHTDAKSAGEHYDASVQTHKGNASIDSEENKNYELKQEMKADAKRKGEHYEANVQTHKGNRTFVASIDSEGNESYERYNGRVVIDVENKDGELSGSSYKLGEKGKKVDEKDLSEGRIRRELKKDREKADRAIKKITNGDVDGLEEYMYSVEAPEHSGNIQSLGAVFDMTYEQTQTIPEEKAELQQKYDEEVNAKTQMTANDIMLQRLAAQRGR